MLSESEGFGTVRTFLFAFFVFGGSHALLFPERGAKLRTVGKTAFLGDRAYGKTRAVQQSFGDPDAFGENGLMQRHAGVQFSCFAVDFDKVFIQFA